MEHAMTAPCEHGSGAETPCDACEREARKVKAERDAIVALIEETAKTWEGGTHPMVEVLLARIRARP